MKTVWAVGFAAVDRWIVQNAGRVTQCARAGQRRHHQVSRYRYTEGYECALRNGSPRVLDKSNDMLMQCNII